MRIIPAGRKARVAVAGVSVLAVAGLGAGMSAANATTFAAPTFLNKSELPQGGDFESWTQSAVKDGLPSPQFTCVSGLLPSGSTQYRTFSNTGPLAAELRETVTLYNTVSAAKAKVKALKKAVKNCDEKVDDVTSIADYGRLGTADGLRILGVFYAPPQSEFNLQLYGIGRDENAVVVTALGQMGKKADAEVTKLTATAKTALKKLY